MENFMLNTLVKFSKQNGFNYLKGEYVQTAKNEIVKHHYRDIGFIPGGSFWILDTRTYKPKKTHVDLKV
jgi:predicted enzyme involved in methoxymalonyl-ACP biosynthesis